MSQRERAFRYKSTAVSVLEVVDIRSADAGVPGLHDNRAGSGIRLRPVGFPDVLGPVEEICFHNHCVFM
jgi:hypothetical protein